MGAERQFEEMDKGMTLIRASDISNMIRSLIHINEGTV
jgi:hypothetical protein